MADPTIKINPTKPCELEFDVTIQGLEDTTKPVVRFVLSSSEGFDCSFPCQPSDDSKWVAKMPPMHHLKDNSVPFRVEVIVDGYYFEPAQGTAYLVTDPSVKFQPTVSKPTVSTSFTVKQEGESKRDKKVEEAASAATITGQYAPTNDLLKPEEEPKQGSVKTAQAEKDDQNIDHTRLSDISSSVLPGETTDPEPVPGREDDEDVFDPKKIAENIVRKTVGKVEKPTAPGKLFKRGKDGRPVVAGLDTPAEKIEKVNKAAKVKEILGKQ